MIIFRWKFLTHCQPRDVKRFPGLRRPPRSGWLVTRMFREIFIILALLATFASGAEYSVRAWQSEDGLPGNVLRSVVQSTDGFLWVAAAEGIARFDGIEFEEVPMPLGLTLPRVGPNRLFATPGGVIWFSGRRGSLLRIERMTVRRVFDDENLTTPWFVSQIVTMPSGDVFARRGGETWMVSADPPLQIQTPGPDLDKAFSDDLTQRARQGRMMPDGTAAPLIDRSGRIWRSNQSPGIEVTGKDGKNINLDFTDIDSSIVVSEFLEDHDNNIWVATPVSGLLRFRKLRAQVIDAVSGLTERAVVSVLEDHEDTLWLGTRTSGVDRIVGGKVTHIELSPTTSGPRRPVATLYQDRENILWAAARDGTVFRWDSDHFVTALPRDGRVTKIDTIFQDASGARWFGGDRRLFRMTEENTTKLGASDGVPQCHFTIIAGDAKGRPWFGTMDGRVFREDMGKLVQVGTGVGHRKVSGLLVESDSRAWATTLGTGLHVWDGKKWHRFGKQDGLPDPRLTCILADDGEHFWFGSLGGIFRISRVELLRRLTDPTARLHWLRIDRSDGLPTRECIGSALPSGWRGADGTLYFPNSRGLVSIRPADLEIDDSPPPVFLTSASGNGYILMPKDGHYILGPGRSRLRFSYHGLGLSAPEKITYRTRLLGLDDEWREVGDLREITYETVPPGRYTFEVMAINGDGIWSANPATAEIEVTPHYWQTRWFLVLSIAIVLAAAAGAGWIVARVRMKRRIQALKLKQSVEAERSRISRDLHDDLGASLTELSILSALAAENPDPTSLRPSLDQFSGKAKTVVGTLDEIVWAVTPAEDSLRSLIEYLSAFAREFLENAGIPLRTEIVRNIPDIPLGPNRRHNVFLASRETINNAVKHASATEIHLQIAIVDQRLVVRIRDNGKGFPTGASSSGDGLGNLRKRMSDCGGECDIESEPGSGTTVTLTLPLPPPRRQGP